MHLIARAISERYLVNLHRLNNMKHLKTNSPNKIIATDEPGAGGAHHRYEIQIGEAGFTGISFQKGPLTDVQAAGVHNEDLLAIVIDRLQGFQGGPFVCRENAIALTHLETALLWLNKRTQDRKDRGVEGQYKQ